jgi:hypothetical protein
MYLAPINLNGNPTKKNKHFHMHMRNAGSVNHI